MMFKAYGVASVVMTARGVWFGYGSRDSWISPRSCWRLGGQVSGRPACPRGNK